MLHPQYSSYFILMLFLSRYMTAIHSPPSNANKNPPEWLLSFPRISVDSNEGFDLTPHPPTQLQSRYAGRTQSVKFPEINRPFPNLLFESLARTQILRDGSETLSLGNPRTASLMVKFLLFIRV